MKIVVTVKLHSKLAPKVTEVARGEYVVHVQAKPHDGEANREVVKLLSKYLKVPKTQIKILTGLRARRKTLLVPDSHTQHVL